MFSIDKSFECCYGHRVWSQTLKPKFSLDSLCKCRHLHGHQMLLKIGLTCDELKSGMVTDFKHLNCIKKIVDDVNIIKCSPIYRQYGVYVIFLWT